MYQLFEIIISNNHTQGKTAQVIQLINNNNCE